MFILRSLKGKDAKSLFELARKAHSGVTSLPKDLTLLKEKAELSEKSFLNPSEKEGFYLFLLEDMDSKEAVGVSGIYPKICDGRLSYLYRLQKESFPQKSPLKKLPITTLHAASYKGFATEIGSLFLKQNLRKEGLGKLLSLGRFMYMAEKKSLFDPITFASLRGFFHEDDNCPFFDGIARKLIDLNYESAASYFYAHPEALKNALSPYPIVLQFLSEALQKTVGAVHPNTSGAKNMLFKQGFKLNDLLDPLDGGPLMEAKTDNIKTIKESFGAKIKITDRRLKTPALIASFKNSFKAAFALVEKLQGNQIALENKVADALELISSDTIRIHFL